MNVYETSRWSIEITKLESVKGNTASSVWIKDRRRSRKCINKIYWDTWMAAHSHLVLRTEKRIKFITEDLKREGVNLVTLLNQKEP